ncbi:MAG: hypothetical protein AAF685_12265 [Cyanobacteria bacterium P01_C01_bin.89]
MLGQFLIERLWVGVAFVVAIALMALPPQGEKKEALFKVGGHPLMPQIELMMWD